MNMSIYKRQIALAVSVQCNCNDSAPVYGPSGQ